MSVLVEVWPDNGLQSFLQRYSRVPSVGEHVWYRDHEAKLHAMHIRAVYHYSEGEKARGEEPIVAVIHGPNKAAGS